MKENSKDSFVKKGAEGAEVHFTKEDYLPTILCFLKCVYLFREKVTEFVVHINLVFWIFTWSNLKPKAPCLI